MSNYKYQLKNANGMYNITDNRGNMIASFAKEAAAREYLTNLYGGSGKKEKSIERSIRHIAVNTQRIANRLDSISMLIVEQGSIEITDVEKE